MIKQVILFLLIILSVNIYSQNQKVDSLINQLNLSNNDTTIINLNIKIGDLLKFKMPDSALFYYSRALELSDKAIKLSEINADTEKVKTLKLLKSNSLRYIGIANADKGRYDIALEYYNKSLRLKSELNDKKGMASCYNSIGIVNRYQGNYEIAIEYYLKSLKINEELDKLDPKLIDGKKGMANCYNNIGIVYADQKIFDKSIEYYLKALNINEELVKQNPNFTESKKEMSKCYNNIGIVHSNKREFDTAIEFYLKALKINEELADKTESTRSYNNIGNVYANQKLYENAIENYLKALKIMEELGDKNSSAVVYANIAAIHIVMADSHGDSNISQKNGNLNASIKYALKSYDLAVEIGAVPIQHYVLDQLKKAYTKLGKFKDALDFAELYISTQDSLFNTEKTKSLADIGAKYESEKKQLQIDKLGKEKELQLSENKKQVIVIWFAVFALIVAIIIAVIIFRSLRTTRLQKSIIELQKKSVEEKNLLLNQKNEEIQEKSEEILAKNEELNQRNEEISSQRDQIEQQRDIVVEQKRLITDSINYASNIQRAILKPISHINQLLPESFVVFKPKDVVGGDFYWYKQIDYRCIIVVADCTGHGVPGAFMTLIGNAGLNQIVALEGIDNPALILQELNSYIQLTLRQNNDNSKADDGMDVGICVLDLPSRKLTYSGAKISLFHYNGIEIIEHKGDRCNLGYSGNDDFFEFSNFEFILEKNHSFYMTTDGFIDISYGKKGFSLGKKKFKTMLLENCQKSMKEQGKALEDFFMNDNLSEKIEQRDDISVMGFKI
ncbi:MAG: hypothetical protein A2033_01280 [Bacteroidetes bacterium GWA2_31_9]|nr:MAG: hypothetical protein A2033_01280 [Bacteroidetes bacterium GWA2_31_9]